MLRIFKHESLPDEGILRAGADGFHKELHRIQQPLDFLHLLLGFVLVENLLHGGGGGAGCGGRAEVRRAELRDDRPAGQEGVGEGDGSVFWPFECIEIDGSCLGDSVAVKAAEAWVEDFELVVHELHRVAVGALETRAPGAHGCYFIGGQRDARRRILKGVLAVFLDVGGNIPCGIDAVARGDEVLLKRDGSPPFGGIGLGAIVIEQLLASFGGSGAFAPAPLGVGEHKVVVFDVLLMQGERLQVARELRVLACLDGQHGEHRVAVVEEGGVHGKEGGQKTFFRRGREDDALCEEAGQDDGVRVPFDRDRGSVLVEGHIDGWTGAVEPERYAGVFSAQAENVVAFPAFDKLRRHLFFQRWAKDGGGLLCIFGEKLDDAVVVAQFNGAVCRHKVLCECERGECKQS